MTCSFKDSQVGPIETLRSRFGNLTTNGKPQFVVSGFMLAVCPRLGLKIRGFTVNSMAAMFVFICSFTSVLAEKSSSKFCFYEKEFNS